MILTDEKITVTHDMMERNGMTRGAEFGIPHGKGLEWKKLWNMNDSDFEKLEEYFLKKAEDAKQKNRGTEKSRNYKTKD